MIYVANDAEVFKCLDLTSSLVLASIQSGKFEAKDGKSVATFFDQVFGQIAECANLTSCEFVEKWNARVNTH